MNILKSITPLNIKFNTIPKTLIVCDNINISAIFSKSNFNKSIVDRKLFNINQLRDGYNLVIFISDDVKESMKITNSCYNKIMPLISLSETKFYDLNNGITQIVEINDIVSNIEKEQMEFIINNKHNIIREIDEKIMEYKEHEKILATLSKYKHLFVLTDEKKLLEEYWNSRTQLKNLVDLKKLLKNNNDHKGDDILLLLYFIAIGVIMLNGFHSMVR